MSELPPWRSPLARALHRNRSLPHLKFVQLATVDSQGRPHNRTVVYRGLIENSNDLKFITDRRSEKIHHLGSQPWVEVCWYFTKTREQFRFAGLMQVITGSPVETIEMNSDQYLWIATWQKLFENAQRQFYWPTPGRSRSLEPEFSEVELTQLPPETFALLRLQVKTVEHLQLRGNPQNRDRYILQSDQTWRIESLNP